MYYSNGKLAVAQIPKAGLMSIRDWLNPAFKVVTNDEALAAALRVLFIRNPFKRYVSAFSFIHFRKQRYSLEFQDVPTDDYHLFVDHTLTHDNEHWRPQTIHAGTVPNRVHRFEHIASYVDQYHPGTLQRLNITSRLPTDDYRQADLAAMYAEDLATWELA